MTAVLPIIGNIAIIFLPSLVVLWMWHRGDHRDDTPALTLRAAVAGLLAVPAALLAGWGLLALLELGGLADAGDGALWMTNGLFGGRGAPGSTGGTAEAAGAAAVTRSEILARAFLVAGLVEEAAKLALVLVLLSPFVIGGWAGDGDRSDESPPGDGRSDEPAPRQAEEHPQRSRRLALRHGAAAGLTFGVLEAALQLLGPAGGVLLRVLLVVPLHAALTGLLFVTVGAAIRRARRRSARGHGRSARLRLWIGVIMALATASAVHGAYNIAVNTVVIGGAMIVAVTLIAAIIANGIVVTEKGADTA
jgi:RsiW-degrading membrane proteinase PrsW (M82 family)